jgi:hypothetical protein
LKNTWLALICAVGFTASGQVGDYLGPGVLSRGAGDIGTRGGEQVDLRYYFDVTGVYDTGYQPYAVDSKGNLVQINGLYGVEADFGAYGTHRWRRASIGLDYVGDFYHYVNDSSRDGSSHRLSLGYTFQQSRRIVYEMRVIGGTSSLGVGAPGFYGGAPVTGVSDVVSGPSTLLFDNRVYYLEPSMDMTFLQTARTSYTVGGNGFFVRRAAVGLADLNGYELHGTIRHRLSKNRTIGVTYEHTHYDFPPTFGQSDLNSAEFSYSDQLGRRWTVSLSGGVFETEVEGIQQVALDPVIAALLGVNFGQQTFARTDLYPSGRFNLTGKFKTSTLSFSASQTVVPGNGVYLTSRQQAGSVGYSYTGVRKWNFGFSGGYTNLNGIGQGIQPYATFSGGAGITYNVTRALHVIARFDSRYQQIDVVGYNRTGYRAAIGLGFSPGTVPLSLW